MNKQPRAELSALESRLGYSFRAPGLARLALTHLSAQNSGGQGRALSYQRLEFLGDNRAASGLDHYALGWECLFSAIRGFAFGIGLYRLLGLEFAIAFGLLITFGQIFAYSRGMRPALDYVSSRRPRLTRRQFWGTVVRTVGYTVTALICSALVHQTDRDWPFAIRVGLVTGLVTGVGITVNPFIEYYADNLPERRLGAFGMDLSSAVLACNHFSIGWLCSTWD